MISGERNGWQRIEFENTPIYVRPDRPDWFVPNRAADQALSAWMEKKAAKKNIEDLLMRMDGPPVSRDYRSRTELLSRDGLRELWIHVTNRCNMQCGHCMFSSSPQSREELSREDCELVIREAHDLGCRIFFFTGGEPLLSEAFLESLRDILRRPDTRVVVLTNLSLLSRVRERLRGIPAGRLHFQVSLDGLEGSHDALRGPGAFDRLMADLGTLRALGLPATLSMTVTGRNVDEMRGVVELARSLRISNVHFLWLFGKGNADDSLLVEPERIFEHLRAAQEAAEENGVTIDNIEALRSQVFSCPGTRYDLPNAGWQSIAVGPDGRVYPTPALVSTEDMDCGHIREGLQRVWEESSVLNTLRGASLNHSESWRANPFRYLIGGGDIDHSYINSRKITGGDPYVELYNGIVKWLIVRESEKYPAADHSGMKLRMGEKLGDCPLHGGPIFFTHSNCVLSLSDDDNHHSRVDRFYSRAALEVEEEILNPVSYEEALVNHIPEEMRYRSYGCGSPVLEAGIGEGETVVDLGSGTGIECFIAARLVGPRGRVIGIDMGETMLAQAERARIRVSRNLDYDNVEFRHAFLESLPLDDDSVDVVISNCVVNLSPEKRRVFREIHRVLKPQGRLVISDITFDGDIPLDIKYDEKLRGECIGGALSYRDLFGLLNDIGFSDSRIVKGFLYRTVRGCDFHSITYEAVKPRVNRPPVLYDFPDFSAVLETVETEPACSCFAPPGENPLRTESSPESLPQTGPACSCFTAPMESPPQTELAPAEPAPERHRAGCMVCGEELLYLETDETMSCHYCGETLPANARCSAGHFVCDRCHSSDAVEIIERVCLGSREKDAVALMQSVRSHPQFRIHGPEHHALVPAAILAALRNAGYGVSDEQIRTGIQRGQTVAGGACAFLGACGAALGAGIAFSVLMGANPYHGDRRQAVQQMTGIVLGKISSYRAPRCCQRDSWLALRAASKLLREDLDFELTVDHVITCEQFQENRECIHGQCPLWPGREP